MTMLAIFDDRAKLDADTLHILRAAFPSQTFERFGLACQHPAERWFPNRDIERCGACGASRPVAESGGFGHEGGDRG